jgi:hypothetical protein
MAADVTGYIVDKSCSGKKAMWGNAECVERCAKRGDALVLVTKDMGKGPYLNPKGRSFVDKTWSIHQVELVTYPTLKQDAEALKICRQVADTTRCQGRLRGGLPKGDDDVCNYGGRRARRN